MKLLSFFVFHKQANFTKSIFVVALKKSKNISRIESYISTYIFFLFRVYLYLFLSWTYSHSFRKFSLPLFLLLYSTGFLSLSSSPLTFQNFPVSLWLPVSISFLLPSFTLKVIFVVLFTLSRSFLMVIILISTFAFTGSFITFMNETTESHSIYNYL